MPGYELSATSLFAVNNQTLTGGAAGGAEVATYDPVRKLALILGGNGVDVLDAATGALRFTIPKTAIKTADGTATMSLGGANSVAVKGDLVAIAVDGPATGTNGAVALFQLNAEGTGATWLRTVTVDAASTPGRVTFATPDMVTFTPDGSKLLVALEGEPTSSYAVDPEGGIGIIDVATGSLQIAGFHAFDSQKAALTAAGVRLNAPSSGATPVAGAGKVSQDLEPEYITVSPDGKTAYATLQEANSLAVIDIAAARVTAVLPFGTKDYSLAGNGLDTSDQDGLSGANANIRTVPVKGLYMPDAVASFELGGKLYFITANEGDAREYSANTDVIRLGNAGYVLDPAAFPDAATLKASANLGRLNVSRSDGDTDGDGDIDVIHSFGARSFSIWTIEDGALVQTFDSGDLIEQTLKTSFPSLLNDSRSDDKGPEPEHVTLGRVDGQLYAFVGLERTTQSSTVMAFRIIDGQTVEYTGTIASTGNVDREPEAFVFVPEASAPAAVGAPMLVMPSENSGTSRAFTLDAAATAGTYTLQILHGSDFEAGLKAVDRAPQFAAIIDRLEDAVPNSITLASGDNYIPSPFFNAQGDPAMSGPLREFYAQLLGVPVSGLSALTTDLGRVDIAVMNALGVQASVFGNHEFDLGTRTVLNAIDMTRSGSNATAIGAQFPYLSANLDFSGDADLRALFTTALRDAASYATTAADLSAANVAAEAADQQIAPWTTITEGGQSIGVLGVTTQILAGISSPGGVRVKDPAGDGGVNNTAELALVLQPYIDQMAAQGINKIILLSHLQQYGLELELATKLSGVDVIIAGGSHAVFADSTDPLTEGATAAEGYPLFRTGADGKPVAIVNTGGEYYDVGRLVVTFDAAGVIIPASVDPAASGAYVANDATVDALYAEGEDPYADGSRGGEVKQLTAAVDAIIDAKTAVVAGYTDVYLQGQRSFVRTQETNFGNLSADANLAFARSGDATTVISIKNGGGIREGIGAVGAGEVPVYEAPADGRVTQLDIENALRFNNGLSLVTVTAEGLLGILENALRGVAPGATPGGFPQVSGLKFSFDPTRAAGDRVLSLAIVDGSGTVIDVVAQDGEVVGNLGRSFRMVTLNFLADGGDGYLGSGGGQPVTVSNRVDLFDAAAPSSYATAGREQKVLADHLAANYAAPATAYDQADVAGALDSRAQNLSSRAEDILPTSFTFNGSLAGDIMQGSARADSLKALAGNDTVAGGDGADTLDGGIGDDLLQGRSGEDLLAGSKGNDTLEGGAAFDRLQGGDGDDLLVGGGAADRMSGGAGRDTFVVRQADLGGLGPNDFDHIIDFEGAGDGVVSGDVLRFEGFSGAASFTYLRDMGGSSNLHLYRLVDSVASATVIVQYAGGMTLVAGDYVFA